MKRLFFALVVALSAMTFAQAQSKIAHVDSQKLLDTMPSRKKVIEEIRFIEKKGIEELTEMDAAVKKAYEELVKLPANSPQTVVQYSQNRVTTLQQSLETRNAELDQQMQQMSMEMNDKVIASVKEAVAIVANRKGLHYVIDQTSALYASGMDITDEVIVELLKIDARKTAEEEKAKAATSPQ